MEKFRTVAGQHVRHKPYSLTRSIIKLVAAVAAVVGVSVTSVFAIAAWNINNDLTSESVALESIIPPPPPGEELTLGAFEDGATILIVGSDSGEGDPRYGARGGALNDVNILVRLNADNTGLTAISIPRDTFVDIPECTRDDGSVSPAASQRKINEALSRGGLGCVVRTVEQLTGQSIPYAAQIEFSGVIAMSNAVGAVPVCLTEAIYDKKTGLNLSAGQHEIKGRTALAFLRTRYGVGDGSDLGRISNQQIFLSALIRKVQSEETLSDPSKLYGIATAASQNMRLSESLASLDTMVSLAMALKDIPLTDITFIQFPTNYTSRGSMSGVQPTQPAAQQMIDAVMRGESVALTGGTAPGSIGSVDTGERAVVEAQPEYPVNGTAGASLAKVDGTPPVTLPPNVTGQKADQVTCSNAN